MKAADLAALAWEMRRAATDEDAMLPASLLVAHLVKLTGEDVSSVFASVRPPPPCPLALGTISRGRGHSITEAVDSVLPRLRLVKCEPAVEVPWGEDS